MERTSPPRHDQPAGAKTPQEHHASAVITHAIQTAEHTGAPISASTARLIAAALHPGAGSALEHFAATGRLSPDAALREVEAHHRIAAYQLPWLIALWDFLEQITGTNPDLPDAEHAEPAPQVFVQAVDPETGPQPCGRWLDADVPAGDLDEQIRQLALASGGSGRTVVAATVGFHGLDLPEDATATEIARYAEGVARHGEAYAVYANHVGRPVDESAFRRRYLATYGSMAEFMAEHPTEQATVVGDAGSPDKPEHERAINAHEARLREQWLCLDGNDRMHVFTRQYGLPETEDT